MAEDSSGLRPCSGEPLEVDGFGGFEFDADDDLSIDIDMLYCILDEIPGLAQDSQDGPSLENSCQQGGSASGTGKIESSQFQSGSQVTDGVPSVDLPSCNFGASHAGAGVSSCSYDYQGKVELTQGSSPAYTCSASLKDWFSLSHGGQCMERVEVPHSEMPSCSISSSSMDRDNASISDHGDNLVFNSMEHEPGTVFGQVGRRIDSKCTSDSHIRENSDEKSEHCGDMPENGSETTETTENTSVVSTLCHNSNFLSDANDHFSSMPYGINTTDTSFAKPFHYNMPYNFTFQFFPDKEEIVNEMKNGASELPTNGVCSSSRMVSNSQGRENGGFTEMEPMVDYFNPREQNFKCEDSAQVSPAFVNSLNEHFDGKELTQPFSYNCSSPYWKNQVVYMKDEPENKVIYSYVEGVDGSAYRKSSYGPHGEGFVAGGSMQCLSGVADHTAFYDAEDKKEYSIMVSEGASLCEDIGSRNTSSFFNHGGLLDPNASGQYVANLGTSTSSNEYLEFLVDGRDNEQIQPKSMDTNISNVSPESIQSSSLDCRSYVDDDSDVYIIETSCQPAVQSQSTVVRKPITSQNSAVIQSFGHSGGMRQRTSKEQMIFQATLQDLSEPKSEATPPDGALAISLLRHQRIALAWMVQKETSSIHCAGGILADDQGLGKTVSTIALILKERPSPFRACQDDSKKDDLEILNIDDENDDDVEGASQPNGASEESVHSQVISNEGKVRSDSLGKTKGRPAAGSLIVCPTSVLRQWADELRNKVTSEANLSVLVYHGSNRTKDPCELATYDVVLTTYSIVSMEVPKQPLADEDEEEKGNLEGNGVSPMGYCSNKKRKYPPSSQKKSSKHKKGMDIAAADSISGPLAKVSWFRVVLDEAQSIKNHRTQVARACWALRAKRRWCLSGTPIQNSIDDLYSYFRFLKYDPYSVYTLFCTTIKNPISRNPAKGYQKLQAVLKTIMLRRTKGTLLDGEPIISLPPKVVELRKVDFTKEERDFYSRLECDSRDQFKEYADAGTVKQNYVNILLMLLRLRQACDHPLLVKGFDSSSMEKSSVEMAKKLPREKQLFLLNCLEASLAICGICNDAPEDALVSVCGHVFCKQCICEHLSGEDSQCPATNCKIHLTLASSFSKATLDNSLSKMHGMESSVDCSTSDHVGTVEPCFEDLPYGSSKIKAALDVLLSLTKPRNPTLANDSTQNVDNSVDGSAKLVPEKAIVFSQWTKMLDLLEACLKNASVQYRRLDGTMSVLARDKAVKDFNTLPEVTVMIMSLKAASLGLNMVAACHVLMLDLWWNPTTEDQAIDRAHRIGQTRPVTVVRLTVKDTVEDRILALQQKKRMMVASAYGEDEKGSRQSRLTMEDLNYLFMVDT